jgi:hypothetical protein
VTYPQAAVDEATAAGLVTAVVRAAGALSARLGRPVP